MRKHLITVAMIAIMGAAVAGCADHHGTPLTPPSPTTSVPILGGGQVPDTIDVPSITPTTTTASKTR